MRHILCTSLVCLGWLSAAWGQISTYPYVQNFDAFPFNNTFTSPYFEPNTLPSNWVNEQAGDPFQDWYGRTIPTASAGTGPNADHTTGAGVYLYVEDNAPNDHDSVILISPDFDVTGLTNPTLHYWVHSNHAGGGTPLSEVNHLLVEVNTGSGWVTIDSVGHLGNTWQERVVSLPVVPGIVSLRLVVNNNNGASTHDIAIDDLSVVDPPAFDLLLSAPAVSPIGYTQIPASQRFAFQGLLANGGGSALTNAQLKVEVGTYADSSSIPNLAPGTDSVLAVGDYVPGLPGSYTAFLTGSAAENDTFPANDTASVSFAVSDSILARDDSVEIGGVGFTGGTGYFGQVFSLTGADTLTSVSLKLDVPTGVGELFRVYLLGFDPATNSVGPIIDSTATTAILAGPDNWYTLSFGCPQFLVPGDYFLAVQQIGTSNMAMAYTDQIYNPNTCYYSGDLLTWVAFEDIPPPNPPLLITLLMRMNLGRASSVRLAVDNAPLCVGDSAVVLASGSANYLWDGQSLGDSVVFTPTGDTTIVVSATSAAGCPSTDTLAVVFNPLPVPGLPDTLSLCLEDTLTVSVSGGGTYLWSTGDTTESIAATASTGSPLTVQVISDAGCEALSSAPIQVLPQPDAGLPDTAEVVCFGEEITLLASNGTSYLWSTGATTASITVTPTLGTSYQVSLVSGLGCAGDDSIFVPVNPEILGTPDGSPAANNQPNGQGWVVVNGGTPPYQFAWQDPAMQTDSVANDLSPGSYAVTVTDAEGCSRLFNVLISNVTGIEAVEALGLVAYPNPTRGSLFLQVSSSFGPGRWQLHLIDQQGRSVWQQATEAAATLRLDFPEHVAEGAYLLHLRSDERQGSIRVVVGDQ
jgi:hypothetical protein